MRLITLNAVGGAQVVISVSIPCRYADFIEDESVTPQGLVWQGPEDNFSGTYDVGPSTEPIILTNPLGGNKANLIGLPAQNSPGAFNFRPADTLLKATSATASTTKLRVRERE